MLDKKLLKKVKETSATLMRSRRELQGISSEILGASKRAIFAVQRDDLAGSKKELSGASTLIKNGRKVITRNKRLESEGMWRAALEEFAEASLYHAAIDGKMIGALPEIPQEETDTYIGALSDLSGELTRSCVLAATKRDTKEVERLSVLVREIVAYLLQLDLTGNLRQKFDQAKQNLRKVEEIAFNLSIHAGR